MANQRIKANLIPSLDIYPVIHLAQYDVSDGTGKQVEIELYYGTDKFTIPSGSSITFRGTKRDKTGYSYEITKFTDNVVTVDVKPQMTVLSGTHFAELRISKGNTISNTIKFVMDIDSSALADDTKVSETDLSVIEKALQASDSAIQAKAEVEQLKASVEVSEKNAKLSETNASSASASSSRSAQASAESASSASQSATNAQASAESASESATTASTKATEASTSATKAKKSETNARNSELNAKASEEKSADMIRATSTERQAEVTVKEIDGVKQYTLFLNEEEIEIPSYGMEGTEETKKTEFQYDFNQFYSNKVDEEDVKKNPSKYLDYASDVEDTTVPSEPVTPLEERITTLEQRQDYADQALQDLICTVMGE